jgi:cytochrome P450
MSHQTAPDVSTVPVAGLGSIFLDGAAYADPATWHAAARRLRREAPVLRVEREGWPAFWAITTHADVLQIERNPEVFTNAPTPVLVRDGGAPTHEEPPVRTLPQMDGEQHRQHRGIVSDWFKPGQVKKLQGRVDQLARHAVDQMAARDGHCDFADIAVMFPLQVILSILGLPETDYDRMLRLTQELFGSEDPDIARLGEDDTTAAALIDMVNYFTGLAATRRACPAADLASVIANAEINGEKLSDLEMLGHFVIIATAGHETTSSAIAGGLLALLDHPGQLALLRSRPELVNAAADELIRYVSPVKYFLRTCTVPTTINGATIEPGEHALLSFASANRDEAAFTNPMSLDVRRANAASHLAFGYGRHFCLGAALARMEIRSLFRELLTRLGHVELAGPPAWTHAILAQGPKSVPITYELR